MNKICKICLQCKTIFYIKPYENKRGGGKYCSLKCSHKAQVKKIKTYCKTCGAVFFVKLSKIKKGWGKFCKRECYDIWQKKYRNGSNNSNWRGGDIKILCNQCNKEKYITISLKRKSHNFCSHKCYSLWRSINIRNNKVHNWNGGKLIVCKQCGKIKKRNKAYKVGKNGNFCSRSCSSTYSVSHIKTKNTSIEIKIEKELIKRNINYQKQVPLENITVVDFLIDNNIVIYADGDYFHNLPGRQSKDLNQNFILEFKGYKVFRFWEHEINKSVKVCINKVERYVNEKKTIRGR